MMGVTMGPATVLPRHLPATMRHRLMISGPASSQSREKNRGSTWTLARPGSGFAVAEPVCMMGSEGDCIVAAAI